MDGLLDRLERRLGRYAIPNLIVYMVGGMALIWAASLSRPMSVGRLELDLFAVRHGEWWRLLTFLFIPMGSGYLAPLAMYFTLWVGRSLEQQWGAFRFNVYYFLGAFGALLAALIAGVATNVWLDTSLLFAFATIAPNETVLLFFVLPVRIKWLGLLSAGIALFSFVVGGWIDRASIAAALLNYILFFGGHWWRAWRGRSVVVRQRALREQFRSSPPPVFGQRACAICGAREADGVDIRVCSCAKCGGQSRALCLEHARNH